MTSLTQFICQWQWGGTSVARVGVRRHPLPLPVPAAALLSLRLLPSLLLLLLTLLTATNYDGSATGRLLVAAQVPSPFKGQGIAPTKRVDDDGKVVKQARVPVYMSILFDKLEDVDGEQQQHAIGQDVPLTLTRHQFVCCH